MRRLSLGRFFKIGGAVFCTAAFILWGSAWCGERTDRGSAPYLLTLRDFSSGRLLLSFPLRADETFTIRYIHSVDHTPVFEVFEVDPSGRLAIRSTYFQMFGAGMGHWPGRGRVDFDGKWTWIRDIHAPLGRFILRVGSPGVDHTILYRNRSINLSSRWAGRRVVVEVVSNRDGSTKRGDKLSDVPSG